VRIDVPANFFPGFFPGVATILRLRFEQAARGLVTVGGFSPADEVVLKAVGAAPLPSWPAPWPVETEYVNFALSAEPAAARIALPYLVAKLAGSMAS
jgi:hypothetical protein